MKIEEQVEHFVEEKLKEASEQYKDPLENMLDYLTLTLGQRKNLEFTQTELDLIRKICRILWTSDEVCRGICEIYKAFIVGDGFVCTVTPKDIGTDLEKIADTIEKDQVRKQLLNNWEAFSDANDLTGRLHSWIDRVLRDGEAILQVFDAKIDYLGTSVPAVRFIDAGFLQGDDWNNSLKCGVQCAPGDFETILSIVGFDASRPDNKPISIPYDRLIFDRRNTDYEFVRGLSAFYPVITDIRRVSKNIVNVSVLTAIQSAIALIRKHAVGTQAKTSAFLNRTSTISRTMSDGSSQQGKNIGPGTVIDGSAGMDYQFPAHSVNSQNFIAVIDKELAQIALRFNLPVAWLTGEVSKDDLTEGSPTVRRFKSERGLLCRHLYRLFNLVQLKMGVPPAILAKYEVSFHGDSLSSASALHEAQVAEIELRNGALSPQTLAASKGRNYQIERVNTILHRRTQQPGEAMPGDLGNTSQGNAVANGAKPASQDIKNNPTSKD